MWRIKFGMEKLNKIIEQMPEAEATAEICSQGGLLE